MITKPKSNKKVDDFIGGAPDSLAAVEKGQPKYVKKGNKIQITLTITADSLQRVDELAARMGQSRAAIINLAIYQGLESGLNFGGF